MNYSAMKVNTTIILRKVATYTVGAAIIVGAVTVGVLYGKHIGTAQEKPKMIIQPSIKLQNVSVAINERKEILIIDRTTGEYSTYEDSVGMAIFNMYAGRIYAAQSSK
jgi:hypothetical protein